VKVAVENTGAVAADAVPQLYLEFPAEAGQPAPVLKSFARLRLAPGELGEAELVLSAQDRSFWGGSGWRVAAGGLTAHIGDSAADIKIQLPLDAPVLIV
jgi:beta-glucosidase